MLRRLLQNFLFPAITTFSFVTELHAAQRHAPCCNPPPACWQGFYVSGQLGGAIDTEHLKFDNANYFNTLESTLIGSHFKQQAEGFICGGAAGFNYQMDNFVIGIEGGALRTNLEKSKKSPFFPDLDVYTTKLGYVATGKARLGYAWDSLLFFISGGWAGGHHKLQLEDTSADIPAKSTNWINGWTAGIGFDCKFAPCLSMGLAYDYIHLHYKNKTTHCPSCGEGVGFGAPRLDNRLDVQTFTFRLNYHI